MIDVNDIESVYPFIAEQRATLALDGTRPTPLVRGLPTAHATRLDVFVKQSLTTVGDRISDITVRTYSQGREFYVDTAMSGDLSTATASFVVTGILGETTDVLVTTAYDGQQNAVVCWAVARS